MHEPAKEVGPGNVVEGLLGRGDCSGDDLSVQMFWQNLFEKVVKYIQTVFVVLTWRVSNLRDRRFKTSLPSGGGTLAERSTKAYAKGIRH